MFPEHGAVPCESKSTGAESASNVFSSVPERISSRPDGFSEREQPTLTSPSSMTAPIAPSSDERLKHIGDRIQQLETDMENVYAQLEHLSDALDIEQTRGRAARVGRYLLWGVIIAAMATVWMMLRLRAGLK
jgi:hypothetical protein